MRAEKRNACRLHVLSVIAMLRQHTRYWFLGRGDWT